MDIVICPKCGFNRNHSLDPNKIAGICPSCGVVYEKYIASKHRIDYIKTAPEKSVEQTNPKQNGKLKEPEKTIEQHKTIAPETILQGSPFKKKGVSINVRTAGLVADYFLGIAAVFAVAAVIVFIGGLFSGFGGFLAALGIIGACISAAVTIAWFGYVIKLLLGIYVNTKQPIAD